MISHPSRLYMDDETILNKNRIEALTDGVFAVVMTLLVLDISIPKYHLIMLSIVLQLELSYLRDYLICGQKYLVLGLVL
jgi:uncharacterized membrane protein